MSKKLLIILDKSLKFGTGIIYRCPTLIKARFAMILGSCRWEVQMFSFWKSRFDGKYTGSILGSTNPTNCCKNNEIIHTTIKKSQTL
jgi:hypothetical protein